jgi:WD40 repeat protein
VASPDPVAIDIRHDGQEVAVALANGSVAVFRVEDGRSRTYPVARSNAYWGDIAYAPSGSQIAVQFIGPNRADPLYILDIARVLVSEVPQSQGNEQTHPYLVWSPDGTAITLASLMETCAHILDVQTGERLFKLQNESGCYDSYAVVWSPDGRTLTLNSPQGMIETIEFASQKVIQSFPGSALTFQPSKAGQPLFISPDGRWLASKGGFGFYGDSYPLQVWRTEGELVGQMESDRVSHRLVSSFAGESVLSLYDDGTLTRWAFAEGAIEEVMGQLPVYVVRSPYYWSPDGRKIATPTDNEFVIWDVVSAQPMAAFDLDYLAAAFSPDSRLIALADWQTEAMIVYDLDNQAVTQTFADVTARGEGVAFSPDGRLLAYGSGNEVIVVDVATAAETAVLAGYPAEQAITKIIWSPTGTALAAASGVVAGEEAPGTMIVWGQTAVGDYHELFRTESVRTTYPQYIRPITLFNPSGTLVALEDLPLNDANYFTIFVYDLEQEAVILELDEHQLSGWESDELLLTAEAQYDTRLTQWDVRTGASALGQASDNGGLTFAPTGGYYAQMDGTGANIARGVEVRHWQSNLVLARALVGGDVGQIGWSPDGRFLAATAGDGSLTIWPVLWRDNE